MRDVVAGHADDLRILARDIEWRNAEALSRLRRRHINRYCFMPPSDDVGSRIIDDGERLAVAILAIFILATTVFYGFSVLLR